MQSTNSTRADQLSFGRDMAEGERVLREAGSLVSKTLHAKPGSTKVTPLWPAMPLAPETVRAPYSAPKPAFKKHIPKGHDAILARLQDAKTEVSVSLLSGDAFNGTIKGRDKFTITFNVSEFIVGERIDTDEVTVYKHGIEYFGPKRIEVAGSVQ